MNPAIKLRLAALGLGLGLLGALIVVVTLNSQKQAAELRVRLSHVDSESFGIADHFKAALRELNDVLRNYRTDRDAAAWAEFLKESKALGGWIDAQATNLTTQPEQQILNDIHYAYDNYLQAAASMHTNLLATAASGGTPLEANTLFSESRRLHDLGDALARAHYDSRNRLLTHANHSLTELRLSVLWLLGLLFLCGLALAAGVYRDMIAPLRVKLVESQALVERQEKLASLGLLAAGVAHEVRNPLTAIKAALFLQQRSFAPGSREFADAQLVEREILRLERIVSNFLQFARPSEPELALVTAGEPLREVQSLLGGQLAASRIQLVCEEPASGLRVQADPEQIKQVLINLVQNAADSIGHDGTITLRARAARKSFGNGETDVAILEVADSGKGIPPEVEKRLFDPFFTTKETGTGLGLPIAAQIVKRHGGALQYQTQIHHGTVFGIVLPLATA